MANWLVYKANLLNHLINSSFLFCRFPLKWSFKKHCWYLYQPKTIYDNYYLKIALLKLGAILVLVAPFIMHFIFPGTHQNGSLIALFLSGMTFTLLMATSIVDLVCFLDLAEVLQCCNWGYRQVGVRAIPKNKYLQEFEIGKVFSLCVSFSVTRHLDFWHLRA